MHVLGSKLPLHSGLSAFEEKLFAIPYTFFAYSSAVSSTIFYRMTIFQKAGTGTPIAITSATSLNEVIALCIAEGLPFHVGHEFRMTLTETGGR